ncbi:MAG: hypothetical protein UHM85_07090 [Acutalibacteraceae bacterium]|nr:hypothetical protein [Acutalibacteraceae bacterium]
MKKAVTLFLSFIMIFALAVCPFAASAITTYGGTIAILPGNTRSSSPEYNYAWLDNVIVRDDAMAVTSKPVHPAPTDYPGSHTYEEFISEVRQYSALSDIDENTVTAAYTEINSAMYYLVTATGMTGTLDEMRAYLQNYGIRLPGNEDAEDKMAIAIVYAALKYDAVYALYEKKVEIPKGVTLDGANVIILSALTDTMLPSGINTLTGFAVNTLKAYVTQFEELPVSKNPTPEEIFHWTKIITAASYDYQVPVNSFDKTTKAQKEYVDYAYHASILNTMYDITVDPVRLIVAVQSEDKTALPRLVLYTMLEEKGVTYSYDMPAEELFSLAEKNGCFALEDEFYSDILNYEITVAETCGKIWFTPFALADQLEGGNSEFVTIKLNEKSVTPNSTTSVDLRTSLKNEKVTMTVNYNDGNRNDTAVYVFNIIKDAKLNDENAVKSDNDMVAEVEKFVNTIIPDENSAAAQAFDKVIGAVDNKVNSELNKITTTVNVLTTYGVDTTYAIETTEEETEAEADVTTQRFDFDYLEQLIDGVYETDAYGNIITTSSVFGQEDESEEQSFIEKATETVKENPEIVVAPTGVITLGSLAGYFLSKKHRDSVIFDEEEEETEE